MLARARRSVPGYFYLASSPPRLFVRIPPRSGNSPCPSLSSARPHNRCRLPHLGGPLPHDGRWPGMQTAPGQRRRPPRPPLGLSPPDRSYLAEASEAASTSVLSPNIFWPSPPRRPTPPVGQKASAARGASSPSARHAQPHFLFFFVPSAHSCPPPILRRLSTTTSLVPRTPAQPVHHHPGPRRTYRA